MPNELDKSLLDRLQALRGSSATSKVAPAAVKIDVDVIERAKPPTREDALAARLKSLREQDNASSPSSSSSQRPQEQARADAKLKMHQPPVSSPSASANSSSRVNEPKSVTADDDADAVFATDDQTLEELLGDVGDDERFAPAEPDDAQVKSLLEQLADDIPTDIVVDRAKRRHGKEKEQEDHGESDDSDGEAMKREADDVLARMRDEIELENTLAKNKRPEASPDGQGQDQDDDDPADFALPSVPGNLDDGLPSAPGDNPARTKIEADLDDISARLARLNSPSDAALDLPSVPSGRPTPGAKPIKRLTARSGYTDDDVDSWCTVCLEDATLRCLGCDDDPYCARCWREMHVGPAAHFDDRSHKAVQFTRDKKAAPKRKVALGA